MTRKLSSIIPIIIIIIALLYFTDNTPQSDQKTTLVSESDSLTVRYLDVGQADATVFHLNDADEEYVILYDVGDWHRNEVVDYLQEHEIDHIDIIMISHPHADHIGQLKPILEHFSVDEVWMTGNETNTNLFLNTMETLLANEDIAYHEPSIGDIYEIGPLHIEVLHPNPDELSGDLNEDSLSILATFGEIIFLFTGDAGVKTERKIVDNHKHIEAHFLQLGHHGSNTSSDEQFIDAVKPTYAIYSAGKNNSYGHPSREVIGLLTHKNIPILGTDTHGTITVTTDGKRFKVATETGDVIETGQQTEKPEIITEDCIDLNNATQTELQNVIHINEVRANEIIRLRPFHSIEQLIDINGIGPKRLDDIIEENNVCVE